MNRTVPTLAELAALPLLSSFDEPQLAALAPRFSIIRHPKHAIVASEGERLERFHLVLAGRVQFFWRDEGDRQVKLGIDGPGGHFADATLFGEPILMSVLALDDLRLASIPMQDLHALLLAHPQVGVTLLRDVVARLRRLVVRTKAFTMKDVYGRVRELLLVASEECDGTRVAVLSHAEIGHRVGATREMVGRVLRDLARGGYIEAGRGRITLLRPLPPRW
jgi:CRP/FNR family cyclic AMP-dependent transcriptional regulator